MGLPIHGRLPSGHYRSTFATRIQCQWCKAHPEDRRLKRKPPEAASWEGGEWSRPKGSPRPQQDQ
jgi:hypothetical protein